MQTSRQYLIDLGLAKPGKGRLSREATKALTKALAEGKRFSDRNPDGTRIPQAQLPAETRKAIAALNTPENREKAATAQRERPTTSQVTAPRPVERVKTREQTAVWGIDMPTRSGNKPQPIAILYCYGCGLPVSYCTHDVPKLPKWLTKTDKLQDALLIKPTVEELAKMVK